MRDKINICKWKIGSSHKKSKICLVPHVPMLNTWKLPKNKNMAETQVVLEKDEMDDIGNIDLTEDDIPKLPISNSGKL